MKKDLRVLVYGGRDYDNRGHVFSWLYFLHTTYEIIELIEGGAPGADRLASDWTMETGIKHTRVKADWDKHGRAAGPIRNKAMVNLAPDLGLAFPGGKGTANMTAQLRKAGIPVWEA